MAKGIAYRNGVTDVYRSNATMNTDESGKTTVSYGSVEVIAGTQSITESPQTGSNVVYESNVMIRNNQRIAGVNVELQTRSLELEEEEMLIYGIAANEDGSFDEGPDNTGGSCAIGFGKTFTDGSVEGVWYYMCEGSAGDSSIETATENENTPANTYTFGARPSPEHGYIRRRKMCRDMAEFEAFMASVPDPGTAA